MSIVGSNFKRQSLLSATGKVSEVIFKIKQIPVETFQLFSPQRRSRRKIDQGKKSLSPIVTLQIELIFSFTVSNLLQSGNIHRDRVAK